MLYYIHAVVGMYTVKCQNASRPNEIKKKIEFEIDDVNPNVV